MILWLFVGDGMVLIFLWYALRRARRERKHADHSGADDTAQDRRRTEEHQRQIFAEVSNLFRRSTGTR